MKKIVGLIVLFSIFGGFALWQFNKPYVREWQPIPIECISYLLTGEEKKEPVAKSECDPNYQTKMADKTWQSDNPHAWYNEFNDNEKTSYRYLGNYQNKWAIQVNYSGGGSGVFSNISLINLDQSDRFVVQFVTGGDRCNGQIESAAIEDGKLYYSKSVTPLDIIQMAGYSDYLKPEMNIPQDSLACTGTAQYIDEKLVFVTFNSDIPLPENFGQYKVEDIPYEDCFYVLKAVYINRGEMQIYKAGLKMFGENFKNICIDRKFPSEMTKSLMQP